MDLRNLIDEDEENFKSHRKSPETQRPEKEHSLQEERASQSLHDPQSSHDPQEANPGANTHNQSLQNPDLSRAKENTAAFDKAQSDEDLTDSVFDMFDSFF